MFLDRSKSFEFLLRQSGLFDIGYFGNFDLNIQFYPMKIQQNIKLHIVTDIKKMYY